MSASEQSKSYKKIPQTSCLYFGRHCKMNPQRLTSQPTQGPKIHLDEHCFRSISRLDPLPKYWLQAVHVPCRKINFAYDSIGRVFAPSQQCHHLRVPELTYYVSFLRVCGC
jgi:hypothetical protein